MVSVQLCYSSQRNILVHDDDETVAFVKTLTTSGCRLLDVS